MIKKRLGYNRELTPFGAIMSVCEKEVASI
jgi:hypothetical protein